MPRRKIVPDPYQYSSGGRRIVRDNLGARLDRRTKDEEILTGVVNGIKASDLEERFARSLAKYGYPFEFRYRISSALMGARKLTSQFLNVEGEVEIDFIVSNSGFTPVFIDGEIGHYFTPYQADNDSLKTGITNEFGQSQGWKPSIRVPYWQLVTQEATDRYVRDLFSGEFSAAVIQPITVDGGKITNVGGTYVWKTPNEIADEINTRIQRQTKYNERGGFA
jgi:hypothetical protein